MTQQAVPLTRAEIMRKVWQTRRTNEGAVADRLAVSEDRERVARVSYRYPSNPRLDAAIAEAYRRLRQENNRHAISNLAQSIGWPRTAVTRRARDLGLGRTKESPWSSEEESIVERWGHLTDIGIQGKLARAGFHRTQTAVNLKVKRLKIKQNLNGYSAHRLALALGVESGTVRRWIDRGILPATRRGTARSEKQGDIFWITRKDVKLFVLRHLEEIDLAKVEKYWFLDLVTDGKVVPR